jgi:hypothetical protein
MSRDPVGHLAFDAVIDFLDVPDVTLERSFEECFHQEVGHLPAVLDRLAADLTLFEQVTEAGGQRAASRSAAGIGVVARLKLSLFVREWHDTPVIDRLLRRLADRIR